jgi:hypothetical protein
MAFVLCTGTDPALTYTRHLILQNAGHVVVSALTEIQIKDACQQHKFDVAVIGHSSRRKLKQEWLAVIRELCPLTKVLEVHVPHEAYAVHDADDWMESFSVPDQLAERVSALAEEKKEKS